MGSTEAVIDALQGYIGGATLQDAMAWLGEETATELAAMLEDQDFGSEAFNLEDLEVDGHPFWLMFECGNDAFARRVKSLLSLCRVKKSKS